MIHAPHLDLILLKMTMRKNPNSLTNRFRCHYHLRLSHWSWNQIWPKTQKNGTMRNSLGLTQRIDSESCKISITFSLTVLQPMPLFMLMMTWWHYRQSLKWGNLHLTWVTWRKRQTLEIEEERAQFPPTMCLTLVSLVKTSLKRSNSHSTGVTKMNFHQNMELVSNSENKSTSDFPSTFVGLNLYYYQIFAPAQSS